MHNTSKRIRYFIVVWVLDKIIWFGSMVIHNWIVIVYCSWQNASLFQADFWFKNFTVFCQTAT